MSAVEGASPVATGAHYPGEERETETRDPENWSGVEPHKILLGQVW